MQQAPIFQHGFSPCHSSTIYRSLTQTTTGILSIFSRYLVLVSCVVLNEARETPECALGDKITELATYGAHFLVSLFSDICVLNASDIPLPQMILLISMLIHYNCNYSFSPLQSKPHTVLVIPSLEVMFCSDTAGKTFWERSYPFYLEFQE